MAGYLDHHELSLFSTLAWASWVSRNKTLFDSSTHDPKQLAIGFSKLVMDYKEYAKCVHGGSIVSRPALVAEWKKPRGNVLKINADAAVLHGNAVGLGVVARDSAGKVVFTGCRRHYGAWDPCVAESAAALFGLELARRFGFNEVWLECDALEVVQKINKQSSGFNYVFLFLDRVLALIPSFAYFKCSHVRRGGNTLAHLLARQDVFGASERVCFEPFPESVLTLAAMDLS